MSQKQSLLFFLVAFLLLFTLYMMGANAKRDYFREKENLELFAQEAKSLAGLKSKFGDKKVLERTIKSLNRIATPSRDFKKSDIRVLVYENLSSSKLNTLLRKIGNSTLNLKRVEIKRQNANLATVRLEIKR
jgi:hypothetical protein